MEDCIIYGTGNLGKRAYNQYHRKMNILFFVDSDEKKWGKTFCSLPIRPPEEICKRIDALVLIAIMYGDKAVLNKVKSYGANRVKTYNPTVDQSVKYILDEIKRSKPALLVDAVLGMEHEMPTGTERLVRKIGREISDISDNVIFINNYDGNIVGEFDYKEDFNEYIDETMDIRKLKIPLIEKDKLLFITPGIFGYFHELVNDFVNIGTKIYVVIYDMYKFYKTHIVSDHLRQLWIENFYCAMNIATGILCYSQAVADEIMEYYKRGNIYRNVPLRVFLFPLGSDIVRNNEIQSVRKEISEIFDDAIVLLMVGSLRKHKGYSIVMEALKKCHLCVNVKLLILGQCISKADESLKNEVIETAKELTNILWIDNATDDEVSYCYDHATALIAASRYEGYGLPLVEAAQHGLPIICSDIPVFREVTEGNATFFKVGDSDSLSETLKKWLEEKEHPDSRKIPIHTWRESAEAILDIVEGRTAPYVTLQ